MVIGCSPPQKPSKHLSSTPPFFAKTGSHFPPDEPPASRHGRTCTKQTCHVDGCNDVLFRYFLMRGQSFLNMGCDGSTLKRTTRNRCWINPKQNDHVHPSHFLNSIQKDSVGHSMVCSEPPVTGSEPPLARSEARSIGPSRVHRLCVGPAAPAVEHCCSSRLKIPVSKGVSSCKQRHFFKGLSRSNRSLTESN